LTVYAQYVTQAADTSVSNYTLISNLMH